MSDKVQLIEEHNEDLEEAAKEYSFNIPTQLEADIVWKKETEQHFKDGAKWQKQKDEKLFKEDTWNYIEEQYPDITKEEKLRLYDVSIKSRLAGAKTQKKLDQETIELAEEHAMLAGMEKMREEMMKDVVEGVIDIRKWPAKAQIEFYNRLPVFNIRTGDKVKIIILKTE